MVWPIIAGQPVLARHVRLRSKPSQCGRIRGIFLSLLIPVGVDKRHYAVLSMLWRLFPSDVRASSEERFHRRVGRSKVVWRAFDKAVRTKPPAVAADAGLMEIQLREGTVSRCPGVVRRSAD